MRTEEVRQVLRRLLLERSQGVTDEQEGAEKSCLNYSLCTQLLREDDDDEESEEEEAVEEASIAKDFNEREMLLAMTEEEEAEEGVPPPHLLLYYATLNRVVVRAPYVDKKEPTGQNITTEEEEEEEEDAMPKRPFFLQIANVWSKWAAKGSFPLCFEKMEGQQVLATIDDVARLEESVTPLLLRCSALWASADDTVKKKMLQEVIEAAGLRGLLTCLGLRQTFKSIDAFPPSRRRLLASANKPHKGGARLSVAARALCKHGHRDSQQWWGTTTGPDPLKNANAEAIIKKIFQNATWLNLHLLPHDLGIFEVRTKEGYGARWSGDGNTFRGFLEPQMEDGHEKGWRH
ncbi:ASCH domain-containing protein [Balamuthia mandrillaris]